MTSSTIGPIGHDFEALVELLPYWAAKSYGPSIDAINRVRKALAEHESNTRKDTHEAEQFDRRPIAV